MLTVLRDNMCSNRWAKPERPCGSCFEPTSYQSDTATLGVVVSRIDMMVRPLASLRCLKSSAGTLSWPADAPAFGCAVAGAAAITAPDTIRAASAIFPATCKRIVFSCTLLFPTRLRRLWNHDHLPRLGLDPTLAR